MKRILIMILVALLCGCGHIQNNAEGEAEEDGDVALADLSGDDRSPWDAAMPKGNHAVAVAANWTDPIGSLATIDLGDPVSADTALVTTDSTDAVLQSFGGKVFVINRFGADTIQVIDPENFSVIANYSVGAGSNPQDIHVFSDEKAYVSRLDSQNDPDNQDDLLIVNPLTGGLISSIDLKPYTADDGDRLARATQMVAIEKRLFVLLQDLPSNLLNSADAPGKIAVIDMDADEVLYVIGLSGWDPSDITYSPITEKIYVANTGVFNNFVTDVSDPYGGIEVVDPITLQSEGIVVDDADFGDYIMHVRLAEYTGYTVVGGAVVASFDLITHAVVSDGLYVSSGAFLPDIAIDSEARVLVTERDIAQSGVAVLDGSTGQLLYGPIDIGAMPAALTFVDID